MPNQNPEQIARDTIDAQLMASGWAVQAKNAIDFHVGEGQTVREYTTDSGPSDDVLFMDGASVGVIEAKKETLGHVLLERIRAERCSVSANTRGRKAPAR